MDADNGVRWNSTQDDVEGGKLDKVSLQATSQPEHEADSIDSNSTSSDEDALAQDSVVQAIRTRVQSGGRLSRFALHAVVAIVPLAWLLLGLLAASTQAGRRIGSEQRHDTRLVDPEDGGRQAPQEAAVAGRVALQIMDKPTCSNPEEDCRASRCCIKPGETCYQKNAAFASCLQSCKPGHHDEDGPVYTNPWSCAVLGGSAQPAVVTATPAPVAPAPAAQAAPEEVVVGAKLPCSGPSEDCRASKCCSTPGSQCFEKNAAYATCMADCAPGVHKEDVPPYNNPWSCQKLGTVAPGTVAQPTAAIAQNGNGGFPSLFCFAVALSYGREPSLMQLQYRRKIGIFACDAWLMLCSTGALTLAPGVSATSFAPADAGVSKDGTAANTQIFMNAWDTIASDGRYASHDWTVKSDPDSVFLPDRLRNRVKAVNGQRAFFRNCNAWSGPDFPSCYGSLEVISKSAAMDFVNRRFDCKAHLPAWPSWGEDLYLKNCLQYLGVQPIDDFGLVADGLCSKQMPTNPPACNSGYAAAFHYFKDAGGWEACYNTATR